jgi:hypothetical protein
MTEDNKSLQESIEYFDKFVNAAISQDLEGISALETVKHYNNIRNVLANHLVTKE